MPAGLPLSHLWGVMETLLDVLVALEPRAAVMQRLVCMEQGEGVGGWGGLAGG